MDESSGPLFAQVAELVENAVVDGSLAEGDRAPSTNELAAFHGINPATARKGLTVLVERGVLTKRRGVGMFVEAGAREEILRRRRDEFAETYLRPLLAEATHIGITPRELTAMIDELVVVHHDHPVAPGRPSPDLPEGSTS